MLENLSRDGIEYEFKKVLTIMGLMGIFQWNDIFDDQSLAIQASALGATEKATEDQMHKREVYF